MQSQILPHAIFQIMEQLSTSLNLDHDIVTQQCRLNLQFLQIVSILIEFESPP